MVLSWQFIAVGAFTHDLPTNSWLARLIDFSIQMLIATLLLFFSSIVYGLTQGDGLKGFRCLKITQKNEDIQYSHGWHLSYKWRIGAIYARAAFATSGYFLFELARVFLTIVDNSALFGADALAYAVMFGCWVEKKASGKKVYTKSQWTGIVISASAVIFALVYESIKKTPSLALEGVGIGLGAAAMLAIVIMISSIVVSHDSILRIAFHNCLFGFLASFIVIFFILFSNYTENIIEVQKILHLINLKSILLSAIPYALALLGFLQSYRYIQPVLIAMLGNSLSLSTLIVVLFLQWSRINVENILIISVLFIGSVILGYTEWKKRE